MKKAVIMMSFVLAIVLGIGGATWNNLANRYVLQLNPVPGAIYQVNRHSMHLYCSGSGTPVVVLEAGLGDEWFEWQKVQPELSKTTRVCSYDRAGLGLSDSQPGSRDAIHIARQLHSLLEQSSTAAPLVLVGHSAGGLYIRAFAALYPNDVAGLVFVDATSPEVFKTMPRAVETQVQQEERHRKAFWHWVKAATGWTRMTGKCRGTVPSGLDDYAGFVAADNCRPSLALSWLGEMDDFELSGQQVSSFSCCGDLPILIISQDPDRPKSGWDAQSIAATPIWSSLQEQLKSLSPRSRRIIARSSGHHIMIDRPDVLVDGINEFVNSLRGKTVSGAYGTTISR